MGSPATTRSPPGNRQDARAHGASPPSPIRARALGRRVRPLALAGLLMLPVRRRGWPRRPGVAALDEWGSPISSSTPSRSRTRTARGRYADTTRENFVRTIMISCFSFTEVAKARGPACAGGGAMVTLTTTAPARDAELQRHGRRQAALEASVRYLAVDFRAASANAISAGPIRTLAGAGISDARQMFAFQQRFAAAPWRHAEETAARHSSALRPLDRRHRRHPFRGFGLQHHHHAAALAA